MVDALDQWAFVRRIANPKDASKARELSAIATAADPDPWRAQLRDALDLEATDKEQALATFQELATSTPQEARHRESVSRLAYALGHLGDRETEASLLRRAQRSPRRLLINHTCPFSDGGWRRGGRASRVPWPSGPIVSLSWSPWANPGLQGGRKRPLRTDPVAACQVVCQGKPSWASGLP
jgi:hypothetical protein